MKLPLPLFCALILAFDTGANAAEKPEYLDSFNPAKGFKPVQRDLTEIFLQLAGSLEEYGSPEPYLRHVASGHSRIETLYRQKSGKNPQSFRPDYITDAYLDRLSANWKILSPKIGLEPYAKEFGHMMRDAILGTRGTGTIIVEILNHHQERVFVAMSGKRAPAADFESLKTELISRLELDKKTVDEGGYEVARRDAVRCAIIIHGITMKLFEKLDQGLKPDDAERVKAAILSVIMDTGRMAQSELQAGVVEWAFQKQTTAGE